MMSEDVKKEEEEVKQEQVDTKDTGDELTLDKVTAFLDKDEKIRHDLFYNYKPYQSELDSQKDKHLKTWKDKNLESLIVERENKLRTELLPEDTPEKKLLKQIATEREQEKKELQFEKLKNAGLKYANASGVPVAERLDVLIKGVSSEEDITKTIDWLKSFEEDTRRDERTKVLKQHGRNPESGDDVGVVNEGNFRQRLESATKKYGENNAMVMDKELHAFYLKRPDLFR
jgi:hypothetical protein